MKYDTCKLSLSTISVVPTPIIPGALVDSAARLHCLQEAALPACKNIIPTSTTHVSSVANGGIISPKYKSRIKISDKLSHKVQKGITCDDIKTGFLISSGQLCDENCISIFSRFHIKIIKDNQVIIEGRRTDNGLWNIPLSNTVPYPPTPEPTITHHEANAITA